MQNPRTPRSFYALRAATLGVAVLAAPALADVTGGTGQEFIVSTSGATALSAFTRAGDGSLFNRGPYSLGVPTLQIGGSTYTIGFGQRFGIANKNAPLSSEPPVTADRVVYTYHEIGSINGVNDVAQAGGLLPTQNFAITSGNPLWYMGARLNAPLNVGDTTSNGYAYQGKQPVRIAWSDVRADQAFAIPGTASAGARPTQAGYGKGRARPAGGTNFQQLTDVGGLVGGVDAATTRLRNESIAVVPFTLSANPGTGLSKITEADATFLQAAGRLANGANFNSSVRDIGSGTRNQAGNNLKLDPSFASGERDRVNADGTDKNPFTFNNNDDRPSASITYGDKTSGSSRLRPTIQFARMGLGVLSSGDTAGNGRGNGGTAPLRVLAIDFDDAGEAPSAVGGFVQPTLANVTDGKYQLWSASQAVTVATGAVATVDADAATAGRIQGDQDDDGSGVGITRKFLNNIRGSIAAFGNPDTNQTPFDAIAQASFVPNSIMKVTKVYDGDAQTPNGGFNQDALNTFLGQNAGSSGTLVGALNWADPATLNGDLANAATRYTIFAPGNNLPSASQADANGRANLTVDIEARTVLAGDFNGDAARDLADVEALALAYASPAAYLATGTTGPRAYNGLEVASVESATVSRTTAAAAAGVSAPGNVVGSGLTFAAGQEGLLVLGDLNGNGNVTPTADGNGTVVSVERADVRYFLYGASVDTTGFADRMGDGVRLGQLRKNGAIDRFNAELDALAADGTITAAIAATLKFDKFDVDNDGDADRADAAYVDRNVGKNYTTLADVLGTFDDLVAAELDDNDAISAVLGDTGNGTSDFKLIRDALGAALLGGDTNFDGTVNFPDLVTLAQNYNGSVDRWSRGDFNLDGVVTFPDLVTLAQNYNQSSVIVGLDAIGGEGFAADWQLAQSLVPEPTTLATLGLVAATALRRRRRAH